MGNIESWWKCCSGRKKNSKKEEKGNKLYVLDQDEKKDFDQVIRSAYIYLILIITLIAIITAFIDTFRVGLDVLLPEKSISDSVYNSLEREKNGNIVTLLTNMSMLITMVPIFIYHNKLVKKTKKVKEA